MSTHLMSEEELPWDSFTNLLGEPTGDFAGIDWPPLELGEFGEVPIQNEMNCFYISDRQSPHQISSSSETPTPEAVGQNPKQKAKKRKKGKRNSGLEEDDQSVVIRRRAQVRLAQRAYRNREKATIASLGRDVEDLKARLIGMGGISDEIFEMTFSLPNLPKKTKDAIEVLHSRMELYRLPVDMHAATKETPKKTKLSRKDDTCDIISHPPTATSETPSISKFQPSQIIDIYPSIPTPQPNYGPPIGHVGDLIKSSLAFSLQLKHEALREAYSLVKKPETPYYILCQKFRYCIFSSTRDEIVRHLDFLIHESAKRASDTDLTSIVIGNNASDRTSPFSHRCSTAEIIKPESGESYIYPEEIGNYLTGVGLAINSGSPFAEFSISSESSVGSKPTVFEELRQKQNIKISVSKLFSELLARMVCLVVGPGILASKIDEAIQSTLVAAV